MMNCMLAEPVSKICVMHFLFVLLGLVVFRRFIVMVGGLLMITSSVMIVFPSF